LKPGERKRVKQALARKRNRKKSRRDFTAEPSGFKRQHQLVAQAEVYCEPQPAAA
jgi:hypothetical protein